MVAKQLTDKLIEMGFEAMETAVNITQINPNQSDVFGAQDDIVVRTEPTLRFEVEAKPDLTLETSANVIITPTAHNTFSIEMAKCHPKPKRNYLNGHWHTKTTT